MKTIGMGSALLLTALMAAVLPACPAATGEGEGEGEGELEFDLCLPGCTTDADCDAPLACDEDTSTCGLPSCTSDARCVAEGSGWSFTACDADTPCAFGLCVDADADGPGTAGGCAFEPAPDCTAPFVLVTTTDLDGNNVDVCGFASTCGADGVCTSDFGGCETDADCADFGAGFDKCIDNACGCATNDDCTDGKTTCTADHYCGCTDDSECAGAGEYGTKCYTDSGFCGCADDTECDGQGGTCETDVGFCSCTEDAGCGDGEVCSQPAANPDVD